MQTVPERLWSYALFGAFRASGTFSIKRIWCIPSVTEEFRGKRVCSCEFDLLLFLKTAESLGTILDLEHSLKDKGSGLALVPNLDPTFLLAKARLDYH